MNPTDQNLSIEHNVIHHQENGWVVMGEVAEREALPLIGKSRAGYGPYIAIRYDSVTVSLRAILFNTANFGCGLCVDNDLLDACRLIPWPGDDAYDTANGNAKESYGAKCNRCEEFYEHAVQVPNFRCYGCRMCG